MPNNRRYTLDDLAATLPDAGINLAAPGHEDDTMSEEEFLRLGHIIEQIKQLGIGLV